MRISWVCISITVFLFFIPGKSGAQKLITGPLTGAMSACEGTAPASPNIEQFTVSGNNLTGNVAVSAPVNFEVSLAAGSGYGGSLVLKQSGGTLSSTVIYVRSSASAPSGNLSGKVLLTSPGAVTQMVAVTGTVTALATVNPVPDQTKKNGMLTDPVHFTGTGNYFKWVNDTPGIGLAAGGTGDIPSVNAINKGSKPVTATITVTPYFAGSVYVANDAFFDVSVISTLTNTVVARIPVGVGPESVTVSPDGSLVYFGNMGSGTISVINARTNTVAATIPADITPWGLCITPDGSKLYVVGAYGQVLVIDALTYATLAKVTVDVGSEGVAASPDGKYVYIAGDTDTQGFVYVMSTADNTVIASIPVGVQPIGIAVTPDGSRVYVADYGSEEATVINTATNKVVASVVLGINPIGVAISPDGSRAYIAVENGNSVAVINTSTNALMREITVGQQPFGVSVTPDGSNIYAVNAYSCNVSVIDAATDAVTDSIPLEGHQFGPYATGEFITAGMCSGTPFTFTITVTPTPPPVITAGGILPPLTTTYGTPSATASFNVSATDINGPVLVTPPTGFELSADGITFTPVVALGQAPGLNPTPVFIRLAAEAPVGSYSGNIILTSPAAATVDVNMPASTVTPAPLTITADNKIKFYEAPDPVFTASYTGFENSETAANLAILPTFTTTATITSPVGQYPILPGGASSGNYTITYVPGVLTIIKSLTIPNAFTPNGDGINDTWNITALNSFYNCTVEVFSRWGQRVYSSIGYGTPWDGTYKGAALPAGAYYYIINLENSNELLSGFVTIIR